ncbi:MAG: flagellar biosynthetic protein FliO [Actinobacteria bacterium]|nr:flagellar biosynthetic protein FliO [Actinomycetota bacterium]
MIKANKKKWAVVIVFVLLLLLTMTMISFSGDAGNQVPGNVQGGDAQEQMPSQFSFSHAVVRTIAALIFVIVLLFAFVYGVKWLQNKTNLARNAFQIMSVVSSLSLGPKKGVYLIKVVNRLLVVGLTDGNISLLAELDKDEAQIVNQNSTKNPKPFASALAAQLSNFGGSK